LPLAIGMLASQLRHHPARTAGELAAGLAAASDRWPSWRAENVSVAAHSTCPTRFWPRTRSDCSIGSGCSQGPASTPTPPHSTVPARDTARRYLDVLYDQHLIAEPAPGRYLLHDLLREHARMLAAAAADPAESSAAIDRLLDYYLHTALAVGRHFASWLASWTSSGRPG
jgi:hypothetical protein